MRDSYTLEDYLTEALAALEERDDPSPFQMYDDLYDVLVDLIAHKSRLDPESLRITEEEYKNNIEQILDTVSDTSDPTEIFHKEVDNLEKEIHSQYTEYELIFPINLRVRRLDGLDMPLNERDLTFQKIPKREWDRVEEIAKNESTFDQALNDFPTLSGPGQTSPFSNCQFWKVKYESASMKFAVNHAANVLGLLLGKIAFASYYDLRPHTTRQTTWKYGVTPLQYPICYLVLQNGEYKHYFTSYDYSPRWRDGLSKMHQRRFEDIYPKLPSFSGKLTETEQHLITAFQSYFQGMSEPEQIKSFLEFWRALEAATLTQDEQYKAEDPLKRGRAAMRPEQIHISDDRINRLVNKRNGLVHKGGDVNITDGDITHLKNLCESSLWFLVSERDDFSFREFRFFFEYGAKPIESILQAKVDREEELEKAKAEIARLEQIIDWLKTENDK